MARVAIVLFNLGGPDRPEAVRPFLFNLFNDPAIIAAPGPIRWLIATLISRRRAPVARAIYDEIGGRSPLLELTNEQARALESALREIGEVRAFVAMRYWHPMSAAVAGEVKAFEPDEVILLPLYPQFSSTTSGSSLADWARAAAAAGLDAPTKTICCYPLQERLIEAEARLIAEALDAVTEGAPRLLLSAHGLPKKIVAGGDPYQWQVEQTAAAIVERLARPDLDWTVCYQSRVGPLEWIGPYTDEEIERAGAQGRPLVIAPIAFVSEHSETLVELDITYYKLARGAGVPEYIRVPALGSDPGFIAALAEIVREALNAEPGAVRPAGGARLCPGPFALCALGG
jgi:ferrochelatase